MSLQVYKRHNQGEAVHLPKQFQWVNINVQSVKQFARSDSLRRHLTSGICSEDTESEIMSENEESTMSEESDAETSRSHQKEDILGKYEDKDYGIHDDMIQTILMKMMETNIILNKRANLILGHFLLMELIVSYKTHSMEVRCTTYNREKSRH